MTPAPPFVSVTPAPPSVTPAPPSITPAPPSVTPAPAIVPRPRPLMAEPVPPFYGDRMTVENASDFLKAFNWSMLFLNPLSTDAQKIAALANYLGMGSPAETWYQDQIVNQVTTWADVTREFNARWPPIESARQMSEEYQTELLEHRLPEEEIGIIKTVGRQKVWMHIKWVEEAMELVRLAGIEKGSTLIWQVKKQLPKAIHRLLDDEYTTWDKFTKAVKELNMSKLKQEREEIEERKKQDEECDQKLLQRVEAAKRATAADLTAQLQCLTIGQVAVPCSAPERAPRPGNPPPT
ncbi:hypothetical protein BKA83DRAFT_4061997 [Pisolithus microcarpus]|nr:hypothetical protein BKA83DRAFT_4061997 [Pisolithus microcarpus]